MLVCYVVCEGRPVVVVVVTLFMLQLCLNCIFSSAVSCMLH
jgi:hypothetical protein